MNTSNFIKVLQHFSASSREEAEAVLSLKEYFPFSQVLHAMSARVSKDHGFNNHQTQLQLAAVYAADRGVLKEIMSASSKPYPETKREERRDERSKVDQIHNTETSDLAQELFNDLERLQQLRENFEMMFINVSTTSIQSPKPDEPIDESIPTTEGAKSKKQRIIELARAVSPVVEAGTQPVAGSRLRRRKKDESGDAFINEIATKEELIPESEKQKEQIEIIDHFIKKQPSISGVKEKDKPADQPDLTTIKTGEFGDNIVSETLVEILIRQGKKDKAIEVLKKLIWKFPQKKAYFAAQIEDLKK